jgi:hypothetical protein
MKFLQKILASKVAGETPKKATFLKQHKQLVYFTSRNTSTTVNCETLEKAKKIVEKSGVKQELEIK